MDLEGTRASRSRVRRDVIEKTIGKYQTFVRLPLHKANVAADQQAFYSNERLKRTLIGRVENVWCPPFESSAQG